jgi:hypothetical protein
VVDRAVIGEVATRGVLLISTVEIRVLRFGERAIDIEFDCSNSVLAFRRLLPLLETLAGGLDASKAANEDIAGLRYRFVERISPSEFLCTRLE